MEKKIHFLSKKLLWAFLIVQIAMLSSASDFSTTEAPEVLSKLETENTIQTEDDGYAWSAWGSWSACSRTCGGGVSVQERQCLPRTRIPVADNSSVPAPVITVRVTRHTHEDNCIGIDKRYHECNNIPCPGVLRNNRAAQCAAFDRRPFRGHFYTWVPYIDGNSPCTLNCRPLGQHFYASLSLVADGTPCTRQGSRAICIQGTCKAVGHEGVLSSVSSRDALRCGRRVVSGLFSRPRLPLGYSYVTTVPKGACRLNVSEIMPSENYIALKISNGSYIVNGEFAVSAPGMYEAAGARFAYSRSGSLDTILALGPIRHAIDIMILYTQPNPSIKYEYFTESGEEEGESETNSSNNKDIAPSSFAKHFRRHYGKFYKPTMGVTEETADDEFDEVVMGTRKFAWKIVSYTQCTRTCGGGIQLGKYRCVEASAGNREVSNVHCVGAAPQARRRRCGTVTCPPRWRAAAWTSCPTCGPATRTRIVGCVQDHSRGITKISDQKCPAPKPPTTETCDIPDCNSRNGTTIRQITSKRVLRPLEHTDTFREGPVYTVTVNSTDLDVGPEYSFSATAGWLHTDWSECVGWCVGGGIQTRSIRCADPAGCSSKQEPETSRNCSPKLNCEPLEGQWFTSDWSPCSSSCGGKQIRGVLCIGGTGRHLKDTACRGPKPPNQRDCGTDCKPTWYYSEWGQCVGNCTSSNSGSQRRSVVCSRGGEGAAQGECGEQPPATRTCDVTCAASSTSSVPPTLSIESQKVSGYETTQRSTTSQRSVIKDHLSKECSDKLSNCMLAVQARLCHYKYYIQNCCHSCAGR